MKIIKTDTLLEEINNIGEFEEKIHPEAPASFADAVKDARKQEEHAKKVFDDKEKEVKDLDNTEEARLNANQNIKIPDGKKLHLTEDLFEAYSPLDALKEYLQDIYQGEGYITLEKIEMDLDEDPILEGFELTDVVKEALDNGWEIFHHEENGYSIRK